MDNLFSGVALFRTLYERGFMAVGTLRENRVNLPKDIVGKKTAIVKKLKRGESLWRQSGYVFCVTWKDTKAVSVLSTFPIKKATLKSKET